MIVENESNWRTDDLEALLKCVMEQESFQLDYGIHSSTLILFTTNCKKQKKPDYDDEVVAELDAADCNCAPKNYDDTRLISIRSSKKLEMEILDKLAHIGECVQHMNTANVVVLAKAIWVCVGRDYWVKDDKVEFAKSMDMRLRPKVTRSKVAIERQITSCEWQQHKVQNDANRRIGKLDERIAALKSKIWKLS